MSVDNCTQPAALSGFNLDIMSRYNAMAPLATALIHATAKSAAQKMRDRTRALSSERKKRKEGKRR